MSSDRKSLVVMTGNNSTAYWCWFTCRPPQPRFNLEYWTICIHPIFHYIWPKNSLKGETSEILNYFWGPLWLWAGSISTTEKSAIFELLEDLSISKILLLWIHQWLFGFISDILDLFTYYISWERELSKCWPVGRKRFTHEKSSRRIIWR